MKSLSRTALPVLSLMMVLLPGAMVGAEDWTRFRGPNGTGVSEAEGIPSRFDEEDYNWKVKLPGIGHSQPVVWKKKVFVTSAPASGSERIISCLSTEDGGKIWERRYESGEYHTHTRNSFASGTPAVDERHVYVPISHPGEVVLLALDHEGEEAWRYSLGAFTSSHGFGASPMLFEDTVILAWHVERPESGPELSSAVIALERETGHLRWRTPRKSRRAAYGTPCVYRPGGEDPQLLLTSGAQGIYSIDARTGKPLWEADVFDKRTVSSPVSTSGLVFGTCGSGGGGNYLVAVRPGGEGDVTETHVLYELRKSIPYVPTPVAKDDRIYLWSDKGIASCVKASSGEIIWQKRVGGNYSGSPVWIEGRLFSISDAGEVVVIAAADEFEVLARNPLGEPSRATPAVAGGRMYLRTTSHLISVGGGKVALR